MSLLPTAALFCLLVAADVATARDMVCSQVPQKTPWITTIISTALIDYVPSGGPICTRDGSVYAANVANLTFWAIKMYDASSRGVSPGLLEGRNFELGHFEQCVTAGNEQLGISGKYVVAQLRFEPLPELYAGFHDRPKVYMEPNDDGSAWEVLKPTLDRRVSARNIVSWALCVPASCSDRDVETSLASRLFPVLEDHKLRGSLSILADYSYSRAGHHQPKSIAYYLFLCTCVVLLVLALLGTVYDFNYGGEGSKKQWLVDFSLKRNLNDLFSMKSNEFGVISGLKVISMILIVYGHRMMMSLSQPQFNPKNVQLATGNVTATYVDNGTLVVNTFMTVTGFLTFYKITKDIFNNRDIKVCRNICNRFLRLTPAYLFVMCLQYFVFPDIEGGPMSRAVVWDPKTFGSYWWTHLTYTNNYIKPNHQCLIPSWYLAFDMQMYVFAYLMGAMVQKMKGLAPYLLILTTVLSTAAGGLTVAIKRYSGTYLIYHRNFNEYFDDQEFQDVYLPTHIRAPPYIIGMLGGYLYYHLIENKVTFKKSTLWMWSILAFLVWNLCLICSHPFYVPGREYVLWENVAYAVFHRLVWALVVIWCIYAVAIGNFLPYKRLIGFRVYEPLNKLTYSALLTHTLVQIYMAGYIRAPVNYGRIMAIWMSCGDLIFTYLFSIVLYCFVECPFSRIQQKIWTISQCKQEDSKMTEKK